MCTPALVGYLADKPACVRIPLGAHPEDVTITVNGEVVDGKSAAKAYVDSDALETIVILILPGWAADVVQRKPEMIAEIVGPPIDATGLGELGELAGLGGLGDPSGIEQIDAWGIHTTTITAASVPFHINIGAGFIGGALRAARAQLPLGGRALPLSAQRAPASLLGQWTVRAPLLLAYHSALVQARWPSAHLRF